MISMAKAVLAVFFTSVGLQIVAEKLDFSVAHAESNDDCNRDGAGGNMGG
jgi:hypothetical protein